MIRRLGSKILAKRLKSQVMELFKSMQVGVAVHNGAEAIINGLNALLDDEEVPEDLLIILVDFINAFNLVDRQIIFDEVNRLFPEANAWVQYTYGCKAYLFVPGGDILRGVTGVQQGDPLSALLFCLVALPLMQKLNNIKTGLHNNDRFGKAVCKGYMDDWSIVVPNFDTALECIALIVEEGPKIGLHMSHEKTLLWLVRKYSEVELVQMKQKFGHLLQIQEDDGIEVLGGAVSNNLEYKSRIAVKRTEKCIASIHNVMQLGDPQLCLLLLRSCLGMSKMMYCYRTTVPTAMKKSADMLHIVLIDVLRWIVANNGPGFGEFQSQLAALPIRKGGLGIVMPNDSLHYTYLASQFASENLQLQLFPIKGDRLMHKKIMLINKFINGLHMKVKPDEEVSEFIKNISSRTKQQKFLTDIYYESKRLFLMDHGFLKLPINNTILMKEKLQQIFDATMKNTEQEFDNQIPNHIKIESLANGYLSAMPNAGMGQKMNSTVFRAVLQYRLAMVVLPKEMPCSFCNRKMIDQRGYHHLVCSGENCLFHYRHKLVVEAFAGVARLAHSSAIVDAKGITCLGTKEMNGVTHLRPADILVVMEGDNKSQLAVDVTVVDGDVHDAAISKIRKHEVACIENGYEFAPFAIDTRGILDQAGVYLLQRIASGYAQRQRKSYSEAMCIVKRRMSCALFKGIGQQLQRCISNISESQMIDDDDIYDG